MSLSGKVVLVTGASKGIGQGVALELATLGADVAVNYMSDEAGAQQTVAEARKLGVRAEAFGCDVGDRSQVFQMVQAIDRRFGGVDLVVSGAVNPTNLPVLQITAEAWQKSMDTTCSAVLWLVQATAPIMQRRGGGSVVCITSRGGQRVVPKYLMLGVPKGAMEHLVRYLAVELGPMKIRVNAVSCGAVDTAAVRSLHGDAVTARFEAMRARTPLREHPTMADIGRAIAFLSSPDAHLTTGHTFTVDGGFGLFAGALPGDA